MMTKLLGMEKELRRLKEQNKKLQEKVRAIRTVYNNFHNDNK